MEEITKKAIRFTDPIDNSEHEMLLKDLCQARITYRTDKEHYGELIYTIVSYLEIYRVSKEDYDCDNFYRFFNRVFSKNMYY